MQNPVVRIKKSYLFGLLALLLMTPIPWLYFNPPQFLQGQPLAVYAVVLFLSGMSSAALALFFFLKPRLSPTAARTASLLFLLTGISAYQLSGLAPNWSCFGKQISVATANAAGQNCTTTCTDNDVKPCSGWSTCWDKFVSCNAAGKDQDGRNCAGCCFSCAVVCEEEPDNPPSITGNVSCSQVGDNGWCKGTGILTLTASDPQGHTLTISGDIAGTPFTCAPGNACFQPLPQGNGAITYKVTAAQSGMEASGSTAWKLDATLPLITGTLGGVLGSNGWYLGPVTYNGSASDSLSGLASLNCTLDGSPLGSCNSITVTGEGLHTLILTARDQAGNTQTLNQTISIDIQNPTLTSGINGTLGSNNWYTHATLTASASDPAPGSGLWALEYDLDNSGWTIFPASGGLDLPEGQHNVEVRAVDNAGRIVSAAKSYSLDATLPAVTLSPSGTLGSNNWYTTNLNLSASASDSPSGMDVFEYSLNNGAWTTYSAPLTLGDGTHKVSFWAQDKAGLVKQVDETYQVDTRPPQIAGSLSGVPGANGWYISQVAISASASDPAPGSALDALTCILDGGAETSYTGPMTLSDGIHTIQFDAQDFAGLTDTMTQTIKVDTIVPSLNILTTLPEWNKDTVTLSGTSGDGGSGLTRVEISTDGGLTWQAATGTTAWTYDWDTTASANGVHQVRVRVMDNAGLTTEHSFQAGVDNNPPKISLPNSWLQWDTVTLDVWDNDSDLAEVRIEIRDPEGRWKTRKIDLDPNGFPLNFKWDRRFGDDTVAPLGTYPVKVIAYDNMGNMKQADAAIKIILGILPAGPAATPQPYVRVDSTPVPASTPAPFVPPTVISTSVTSAFGSTPESVELAQGQPDARTEEDPAIIATPRAAPTQTTFTSWLESIFAPEAAEETVTDVSTPETDSKIHWDATLAAMMAAAAAYTLAEKRKQEEERPRGDHAHKRYLEKEEAKRNHEALMRDIAEFNAKKRTEEYIQDTRDARMEAKMAHVDYMDDVKWTVSQYVIQQRAEEKRKADELQAGLAAYYSARKQGEEEAQAVTSKKKPLWEKPLNWIDEHQVEIALGIGIVVGIVALVISGGTATPIVAAWMAGAAAVAGGTVALGTVGLNAYYDRPLMENVVRNLAIAGITAAVVTGGGLLLRHLAPLATTAIGGYCTNYQTACNQIGTIIDKGEEALLFAQSGYYNFVGDQENAAQTMIELQLETADGGIPGNSLALEAGEQLSKLGSDAAELVTRYGDDAIPLLLKYGDDAIDIIGAYEDEGVAILQFHGADAVRLVKEYGTSAVNVLKAVDVKSAQTLLTTLDDDVLDYTISQGPDAVAALSRWSEQDLAEFGPELAIRAERDAKVLNAIDELSKLDIKTNDLATQVRIKELINQIAENSTHGSGDRFVLGIWDNDFGIAGGYVEEWRNSGGLIYQSHPDVYAELKKAFPDDYKDILWEINQSALEKQISNNTNFDYSLNGLSPDAVNNELVAIEAVRIGDWETVLESLGGDRARMHEVELLFSSGYDYVIDPTTNVLHWTNP
jgi:hypothetical protein